MKSKVAGIYLITSKINNKKYVGQSVDIGKRWSEHICRLKKDKHSNKHLQRHFNKYLIEDLTFEVLEEVKDLALLTIREQYYMDLLKPEFNQAPAAGSVIGFKRKGAKNYYFCSSKNFYITFYNISGKCIIISNHYTEEEAIEEVKYIRTLAKDELILYIERCRLRPPKKGRNDKHYYFIKQKGTYAVRFKINGKSKQFGTYLTEQEAIDRVIEVRKELGIE